MNKAKRAQRAKRVAKQKRQTAHVNAKKIRSKLFSPEMLALAILLGEIKIK